MILLIIFICVIVIAMLFMPWGSFSTAEMLEDVASDAPASILMDANHVAKGLSVRFADMRDERIFSKKSGKIRDQIGVT